MLGAKLKHCARISYIVQKIFMLQIVKNTFLKVFYMHDTNYKAVP